MLSLPQHISQPHLNRMAVSSRASMRSRFSDTSLRFWPICTMVRMWGGVNDGGVDGMRSGLVVASSWLLFSLLAAALLFPAHPITSPTTLPLPWSARYAPAQWWAPPPALCPAGTAPSASWRLLPGGAAATACDTRDPAPPGGEGGKRKSGVPCAVRGCWGGLRKGHAQGRPK